MENQSLVTPQEVNELIVSSGNAFHSKVARWFSDNGWYVTVSPYYMDQTQSKAREIDLVVEKLWPITSSYGNTAGYLVTRLFIECKFVPSYSVFWFADKDRKSAERLVCEGTPFRINNSRTDGHHYLERSHKVAKLFKTDAKKSSDNDFFYKALNQALNAMISMRDHPISAPIPEEQPNKVIGKPINFPVVVCSSFDQMFSVDFYGDSQASSLDQNFQLEVRYAYIDKKQKPQDEYFLLDFVEFQQLQDFCDAIEKDVGIAEWFIQTQNFSEIRT